MPVGFSSPARNLFLLGSSGAQVVSNFFESISKASTTDGVFIPDEIRYIADNKKYALAGSAQDSNSKGFGWLERQDYDLETGALTTDYSNRIESTQAGVTTTLRAMELDSNNNLIVVGFSGTTPWIAKYSNDGVLDWQSTTASANVRYLGVTSDSNNNYYACGRTSYALPDTQAFVEKFDSNGNPSWGKQAFMLGRDVVLVKISANDRGEVVAVGFLEDDSANKGYIVKIDTTTGEVLWDRTLERNISGYGGSVFPFSGDGITPADVKCTACYIDSRDQIYVVGSIDGKGTNDNGVGEFLIKYSPEGNIIWQRERDTRDYINAPSGAPNTVPFDVKSDGETEQTVVLSVDSFATVSSIELSKYSKSGDLVFRRRINKSGDQLGAASLDADPSFYYFIFRDQQVDVGAGEPDRYTFGKVSTSGNGLGAFQYDDGTATLIDYTVVSNPENKIGRMSDGSVTNSVSDLMTYPFTANQVVFDDLATHVSNKKRQMDDADSFEYSGSPAIRIADFQELNLLGDTGFEDVTTSSPSTTTETVTWSNDLTTANPNNGFFSAATLAFDGGSNTSAATNATNGGNQIVWSPSQFPAADGPYTLEVLARASDNNGGWGDRVLKVNGTTVFDPAVNTLPTDYVTVSNLSEITEVIVERSSGTSGRSRLDTVKVNGTELIDGQQITVTVPGTTTGTVKDQSGKGNDGVVNGATHNAAGYWEFDGTDDNIVISRNNFTSSGKIDFSIESWFYLDTRPTLPTSKGYIWDQSPGASGVAFRASLADDLTTFAYPSGGGGVVITSSGVPLQTGRWYHAVSVFETNKVSLYVDGVLANVTNGTIASVADVGNTDFFVGCASDGGTGNGSEFMDGRIGEVRVYQRALTAAAVFQNYNATKSKYINEAPDTAPKIGPGIVYDSNLLLNYDFGNRATYDNAENLFKDNSFVDRLDYNVTTNGNWAFSPGPTSSTVGPNVISPVGDLTGGTVVYDGTDASAGGIAWSYKDTAASADQNQVQFADGDVVTYSVYAKIGSSNNAIKGIYLRTYSPETAHAFFLDSGTKAAGFNENTAAAGISADILDVGNGWYRCSITLNITANDEIGFQLYLTNASGATGFSDAAGAGDTIHAWGAQVERNSSAGRLIKTSGTAITAPTTVKNLSGSSIPGTIDSVVYNNGGWFEFTGPSNSSTRIAFDSSSVDLSGSFSIDMWFRQDTQGAYHMLLGAQGYGAAGNGIGHYLFSNTIRTWVQEGQNTAINIWDSAGTTTLTQNVWYNLVLLRESGTAWRWYLNGSLVNSNTTDSLTTDFTTPNTYIGDHYNTNIYHFDGDIGALRMYSRALSATEVLQNFNATRSKYGV